MNVRIEIKKLVLIKAVLLSFLVARTIVLNLYLKVVQPGATGQQTPGAQVMAGAAAPAGAPGAQFQAQPQAQAAYGAYPQATGTYTLSAPVT